MVSSAATETKGSRLESPPQDRSDRGRCAHRNRCRGGAAQLELSGPNRDRLSELNAVTRPEETALAEARINRITDPSVTELTSMDHLLGVIALRCGSSTHRS